jgi:hypothetical protein
MREILSRYPGARVDHHHTVPPTTIFLNTSEKSSVDRDGDRDRDRDTGVLTESVTSPQVGGVGVGVSGAAVGKIVGVGPEAMGMVRTIGMDAAVHGTERGGERGGEKGGASGGEGGESSVISISVSSDSEPILRSGSRGGMGQSA